VAGWTQVKWTQARQVADLMKLDPSFLDDSQADPEAGYRKLRELGEMGSAVRYLGYALPRFEAVAWAAHVLEGWTRQSTLSASECQALDCVQRWLEEPNEEYRRAAHKAGESVTSNSPQRLLTDAVFMSGGSISEPDLPPVQPAPHICGALAASAVLASAYSTADPKTALAAACDEGEKVAAAGAKALATK
jgi:hypothetical protein